MKKKPFILIVDDVAENIKVAAAMLSDQNYQMAFATDGLTALQMAKDNPPDLILLDVMMPSMNGFHVCAQLKRMPETVDIPVIFLTAKTDIESVVQGFSLGGADYLTKPFHSKELQARIKTHLRMHEVEKQLRAINASKDKFLSIISHDLRGPMGSLRDMLVMLRQQYHRFPLQELDNWLDIAATQANQFHKLLENLLSWSRLQRGMMEYHPEKIDLFLLAYETIFFYEGMAHDKSITLRNSIAENLYAFADLDMIHTVLRNLISNAIKFTPFNGCVEVFAQQREDKIEICVRDTGIGISLENQHKLFQLDTSYKKIGTAGEQGTGMGLLLVHELVQKNGGTVRIESKEGAGCQFYFTLNKSP